MWGAALAFQGAPPCGDQMKCAAARDCKSGVCKDKVCASPAVDDGVKNGDETDVDCGGSCGGCGYGQACGGPGDCAAVDAWPAN